MTGQAKHPKKKALTPKPGSRYYDKEMKEQARRAAKNVPAAGRHPIINERPNIRTILFDGVPISFIPFRGTYWITRSDIKRALGIDLGHVSMFLHEGRDINPIHLLGKVFSSNCNDGDCYYPSLMASVAIERSPFRNLLHPHELQAFLDLLSAMENVDFVHSHTVNGQWQRLRAKLNEAPQLEDILKLWNGGATESEISALLSVGVTKVRSAILLCRAHGFEVLDSEAKAGRSSVGGGGTPIPDVLQG